MQLYKHQQQVLEQTKALNKVAYYLDMGLGKTFVGSKKLIQLNARVNLIICQKSKINDWIQHFKTYYDLHDELIFDLTNKKQFKCFLSNAEIITDSHLIIGVVNYDLVFRRAEILQLKNFTLMLDESSQIQNDTAKRTKFILKTKPDNVILLSGTPTSGKYENLWSQMRLLGWEISKELYNKQYVNWVKIEQDGFIHLVVDKHNPYKNVERLKQKMREHGAVFLKTEDCFDLPEQIFIPVKVPKSKEYIQFRKTGLITVDGNELVGDSNLTRQLYARMLCGHYNEDKIKAFEDLLQSTNERMIVFYNFNAELDKLQKIVADLQRPISQVNGAVKDLAAYESEENSVTFVQYQAGAMGLNLQKANKIIYFTLPQSSELFEQSKKRIHRIGQNKTCFYYLLLCGNSIEEFILDVLNQRKDFTDDLFKKCEN